MKAREYFILIFLIFCTFFKAEAQKEFTAGVRVQKGVNLYLENGIFFTYHINGFMSGKTAVGLKYVSSRFGSAIGTNAVKQDNLMLFGNYLFRKEKKLKPFIDLNFGLFHADYESDIFNDLPNNSLLVSLEPGINYPVNEQISIMTSFGYNFITGDGVSGPGTLYPLFYQFSVGYKILKK
ncbi:MAG: hypothetical protein ABFS32_12785 [Bacteroidota bacterium]